MRHVCGERLHTLLPHTCRITPIPSPLPLKKCSVVQGTPAGGCVTLFAVALLNAATTSASNNMELEHSSNGPLQKPQEPCVSGIDDA